MIGAPGSIERRDFVTSALMEEYRPAWHHPNKRIVFEIACPPGAAHGGRLAYSRWTAMPVPTSLEGVAAGRLVRVLDGYYDYASSLDPWEGI